MVDRALQLVVFDDHGFRRAAVAAALAEWAISFGLRIAEAPLSEAGFAPSAVDLEACRVAGGIVVLGGAPLGAPGVAAAIMRCGAVLGGLPMIVVMDEVSPIDITTVIELGVRGLIPTAMAPDVAIAAIQFVLAGGHYFPHAGLVPSRPVVAPAPVRLASERVDGAEPGPVASVVRAGAEEPEASRGQAEEEPILCLTPRQTDVLRSLARGLSNKGIARDLDLSEATVKIHVRHLIRKLGVGNRTQVALRASSLTAEPRGGPNLS